jgi:hydroxylamine dehydrogenase
MRAFQGAFHSNPDYTLWYGWSELQRDLTEIKYMGEQLRRDFSEMTGSAAGR